MARSLPLLVAWALFGTIARAQCPFDVQRLEHPPGWDSDRFGAATALDEERLVVGAPGIDFVPSDGLVRVFRRSGERWELEATLTAPDSDPGRHFGASLAVRGDRIAVGAPRDSTAAPSGGAVYLHRFDGNDWLLEAILVSPEPGSLGSFGESVVFGADFLAVGETLADRAGLTDCGEVTVFRYDGSAWNAVQRLRPADAQTDQWFGFSVEGFGDLLLVGAPGADSFAGAVYVLEEEAGSFIERARLSSPTTGRFELFGHTVALGPSVLAVGSFGEESVTVYRRDGDVWSEEQRLFGDESAAGFGLDVALTDASLFVGIPFLEGGSAGRVDLYRFDGAAWNLERSLRPEDPMLLGNFGTSLAARGTTLVVGEPPPALLSGPGRAHAFEDLGLVLTVEPAVVHVSDLVHLEVRRGSPDLRVGLWSTALDGESSVQALLVLRNDASGTAVLDTAIPPGLEGHTFHLVSLGLASCGRFSRSVAVPLTVRD